MDEITAAAKEYCWTRLLQLHVLLEKNFILARRNWKSTLARLLHPCLFVFLLWVLQKQFNAQHAVLHPPEIPIGNIPKCKGPNCITMLYTPSNNATLYDIMSIIAREQQLTIPTFEEAQTIDIDNYPNIPMYDILPARTEQRIINFTRTWQNTTLSGISFNNNSQRYQYTQNYFGYTVFFNYSRNPNIFDLKSNDFPIAEMNSMLPVQVATDSAIMEFFSGKEAVLSVSKKDLPTIIDTSTTNPELIVLVAAVPFLFCTYFFTIITCLNEINTDRSKKLRQGLVMMGMKELPYWLSWFLTQTAFCFVSSFLIFLVGYVCDFSLFTNSNFAVIYFLFLVYGMSSFPVAFILSTFAKTQVKANGFCVGLFLISFMFACLFINIDGYVVGYEAVSTPFAGFLISLFPSVEFGKICADITAKTTYRYNSTSGTWHLGPGYHWSDLYDKNVSSGSTSSAFGYMFRTMFIWCLLAWYIDNVRPGEHGSRKPLYFFVLPSYWGFGARSAPNVAIYKHNVKKMSSVLPDMDKDIVREHQNTMAMAQAQNQGITILKLSKTYEGGARALDNLTVGCEVGHVLCLLGHNGAGKTTAISVLTGLYEATSGDALIFGHSVVYEMDAIRKLMGVCPQHDILWDELTAAEHLRLFSRLKAVPNPEKEIHERLKDVRLENVANHYSSTFSGGMKRRLSVAIASIGDPKIIFMDEPTSGLDPRSRIQLAELVQKIKRDKILVLTTHSMEEADALGDKIAIMALGRLRAVGDSLHLKNRYGEGYHINLVCEDKRSEELVELIKGQFPRARLRYQSAGNLVYTLPYANHDDVSEFFEWIERGAPYITDWGVSHTTLEEVFLKITHGESHDEENASVTQLMVSLEGIDEPLGQIRITPQTTLTEVRHLVSEDLTYAPPYYKFVRRGGDTIPPHNEHLQFAASFAPNIVIRAEDPNAPSTERSDANNNNMATKIKELEADNERLRKRVEEIEHGQPSRINELEAENKRLQYRLKEVEQLLAQQSSK